MGTRSDGNQFTQKDREIIIELMTNYKAMAQAFDRAAKDIQTLTETVDGKIGDHEGRLRAIERTMDDFVNVRKIVYGLVGLILVAVSGALIALVVIK